METSVFDVVARDNERPEVTMRRFNRAVQESGLARIVKLNRYHLKPQNRRSRRADAVRKALTRAVRRGY